MTEQDETQDGTIELDVAVEGSGAQVEVPFDADAQPAFVASDAPASLNPFDPSSGAATHEAAQGGNAHAGVDPSVGTVPDAGLLSAEPETVDATPSVDTSLPEANNGTDVSLEVPAVTELQQDGPRDDPSTPYFDARDEQGRFTEEADGVTVDAEVQADVEVTE